MEHSFRSPADSNKVRLSPEDSIKPSCRKRWHLTGRRDVWRWMRGSLPDCAPAHDGALGLMMKTDVSNLADRIV